jgi:non-canonical purine NTP pyrophosphatase (RdgB/HAM1 family)
MLKFITGNKAKINEARVILSPIIIEAVHIDLTEIQEVNSRTIIKHKLLEALKHGKGPLIVDDSSLFFSCFNYKLPGPLIKWFNEFVGMRGLANLARKMGDNKARATTLIGYAERPNKILYFEGALEGKIVSPRGDYEFGYDQIFLPNSENKTLAEMKERANFFHSPRGIALNKLKKYILKIS